MSLDHDGFLFFSGLHTPITADNPDIEIIRDTFIGVLGESHLIGSGHGRDLTCELTLSGYSTKPLLQTDLDTLAAKQGFLTGTITETINGYSKTFPKSTFLGYTPTGRPQLDGSGVNGWWAVVRLNWRQRDF